ncbi:hypothetical protein JZL93_23190, partial [Escherichia coli]|nr:hypothetical protein [Escherichia coli]
VVGGPVGDSELLLCHGMVCVVGRMRDLILQLSKSSIYSTKPLIRHLSKTGTGIETPDNAKGDTDAKSVFFCVMPSHSHT